MPEADIPALQRQLAKYEASLAEFTAVEAELRLRTQSAYTADMLRTNRETINAIQRSAEMVRARLDSAVQAEARRSSSTSPFAGQPGG